MKKNLTSKKNIKKSKVSKKYTQLQGGSLKPKSFLNIVPQENQTDQISKYINVLNTNSDTNQHKLNEESDILGYNVKEKIYSILYNAQQKISNDVKNDIKNTSISKADLTYISNTNINNRVKIIKGMPNINNITLNKRKHALEQIKNKLLINNNNITLITNELIYYNKFLNSKGLRYQEILDFIKMHILIIDELIKLINEVTEKSHLSNQDLSSSILLLDNKIKEIRTKLFEYIENLERLIDIKKDQYLQYEPSRLKVFDKITNPIIYNNNKTYSQYGLSRNLDKFFNTPFMLNYIWLNTELKKLIDKKTNLLAINKKIKAIEEELDQKMSNSYNMVSKNNLPPLNTAYVTAEILNNDYSNMPLPQNKTNKTKKPKTNKKLVQNPYFANVNLVNNNYNNMPSQTNKNSYPDKKTNLLANEEELDNNIENSYNMITKNNLPPLNTAYVNAEILNNDYSNMPLPKKKSKKKTIPKTIPKNVHNLRSANFKLVNNYNKYMSSQKNKKKMYDSNENSDPDEFTVM